MEQRDITAEEKRWFKRLQRCLKDMPTDIAVIVQAGGTIAMFDKEYLASMGDDWESAETLDFFDADGILPHSESA